MATKTLEELEACCPTWALEKSSKGHDTKNPYLHSAAVFVFFLNDFIYLTDRDHKQAERQKEREEGKQAVY